MINQGISIKIMGTLECPLRNADVKLEKNIGLDSDKGKASINIEQIVKDMIASMKKMDYVDSISIDAWGYTAPKGESFKKFNIFDLAFQDGVITTYVNYQRMDKRSQADAEQLIKSILTTCYDIICIEYDSFNKKYSA